MPTVSTFRNPAGYAAYLKTPYWREKRLHILRRAAAGHHVPMCQWRRCHAPATEVHHLVYDRMPWYEHDDDLVAVCRHHHEAFEARRRRESSAPRRGRRYEPEGCMPVYRAEGGGSQINLPLRR